MFSRHCAAVVLYVTTHDYGKRVERTYVLYIVRVEKNPVTETMTMDNRTYQKWQR